jgi:sugar phosphate isomerase/epimerase
MKSAVTVSLVSAARGGPFLFWEGLRDACANASSLGFDGIEIFPPSPESLDGRVIEELLAEHELEVAAVGTGGGWVVHQWTLTHGDASVRKRAREFIHGVIDAAAAIGAPAILGSMQGRWNGDVTGAQAIHWLGEALEEFGDHSSERGQVFLYEPLNRYETNLFNRVPDAAAWLRTLLSKNIRILADLFHMNLEEENLPAALREAGALVGHVHFADSNRRAIGFGHTAVEPIISTLREIGYAGYLSAEVFPYPDSMTAAAQTITRYREFTASAA